MKKTLMVMALAGALAAPAAAQATKTPKAQQPTATTGTSVAATDRAFAREAALGSMAEVDLGNLAKEKASSPEVKQFAERMVTDHSKANEELKDWAEKNHVTLPAQLDAKHKATRARLEKLSGAAFDKAYMRDMLSDHKTDVAKFKTESKSAKNADLKDWAGKTLPTLEDHLKQAQDTASKVGVSTMARKGTPKK
jgi:putative membrane protein